MKPATSTQVGESTQETRNWLDLPVKFVIQIFIKLGTVDVLRTAQWVCSLWRNISKEPKIFRCVDTRNYWRVCKKNYYLNYVEITKEALNRCSIGELVELSMDSVGTDELLELAIAKSESRSSLRCLRITNTCEISKEAFIKIAAANPMLEEIDILFCYFNSETIGRVGCFCQHLQSFRLAFLVFSYDLNDLAYAIANNMPALRRLHLLGNKMDNKGLQAILDKCSHLEYLDLRRCFRIDFHYLNKHEKKLHVGGRQASNKLRGRYIGLLEKIQNVRLPNDSTDDYEFRVSDDGTYTSKD